MIVAKITYVVQILMIVWQVCQTSQSRHSCTITKTKVDCTLRHLTKIPDLHHNTSIKLLLLDGNKITTIHSKAFMSTPLLTNLSITHNKLKSLSDDTFSGLKNLTTLKLGNNHLKSLSDNVFGNDLANLHELYLEYNNLTKISQHVFDHLTNLKHLHLEHNNLISIHKHSFNKLRAITWISIDHNYLNNASFEWFRPIKLTLTNVAIHFNPWICDSRMCAYKDWVKNLTASQKKLSNSLDISCCHGNGKERLSSIDKGILCHSPSHKDKHLKVVPNSVATLKCKGGKSTSWTVMTMRKNGTSGCHQALDKSNEKLKITPGQLVIYGSKKNNSGRYCCSTGHDTNCINLKVHKSASNGGGSGVTIAICIIVVTGLLGGIYCFCRRKRRQYGVLHNESFAPSNNMGGLTESSQFSNHPSSTVDKSEVEEAYV